MSDEITITRFLSGLSRHAATVQNFAPNIATKFTLREDHL
jgi:hypothetical protein